MNRSHVRSVRFRPMRERRHRTSVVSTVWIVLLILSVLSTLRPARADGDQSLNQVEIIAESIDAAIPPAEESQQQQQQQSATRESNQDDNVGSNVADKGEDDGSKDDGKDDGKVLDKTTDARIDLKDVPEVEESPSLQEYSQRVRDDLDVDDVVDDQTEDSIFMPFAADPSCEGGSTGGQLSSTGANATSAANMQECYAPPDSTIQEEEIEEEQVLIDATCTYGGDDPDEAESTCTETTTTTKTKRKVDKHWGSDRDTLRMRDQLRAKDGTHIGHDNTPRPPIFLMPGLASTRLVAWRHKPCKSNPLLSDIKLQEYFWLNLNFLIQMSTIDSTCWVECISMGENQTDANECKLRADEGLDAIASLAPGGIGSNLLVGGTNTVYAWLVQWLADNLGYDSKNILGLPYDWRLSPDRMESRDGFFTMTRHRIEAAVKTNGAPGIMVAHSVSTPVPVGTACHESSATWIGTQTCAITLVHNTFPRIPQHSRTYIHSLTLPFVCQSDGKHSLSILFVVAEI